MKEELLFNSLEIRNYRAFDHLVIKNISKVNLFIGKNNVGKSSLLEAIWLYANLGAPYVINQILTDRDDLNVRQALSQKSPFAVSQGIWNLFYGYPSIEHINQSIEIGRINAPDSSLKIAIDWFGLSPAIGGGLIQIPVNSDDFTGEKIPGLVIRIGTLNKNLRLDESLIEHSKRWLLQPREVLDLAIPCPFICPNGIKQSELRAMWEKVVLSELKTEIIESLRIINPAIDDIAVINSEGQNKLSAKVKLEGQNVPVPLKSLGDGMNRLFGIALSLVNARGGILLVDEIENGLHYSILPSVWKFILKVSKRLNIQVFATTHSMDCIKAFHIASKADTSIDGITTRLQLKKGELSARQFDEDRLAEIIEEDIEIR